MFSLRKKNIVKKAAMVHLLCFSMLLPSMANIAPVTTYAAVDAATRANIEASLYNAEYYAKANEDVAVALGCDDEAMYNHWINYGKAEGRNASMVFNAKYYLEVNPDVAEAIGAENYAGAYDHFVNCGLLEGRESSPVFSVKYYLQANTDVANAFNNDYVMAAQHFNESAIAEGRSGSGNFDYTVYRACNTDVADLYGDYVQGYYIHYINHGRAEGRTGGLGTSEGGSTGGSITIDINAPSYRIFDAKFYLEKYPALATSVGTDADTLYKYWISEGIAQGQTASPVIVPEEYLELNADVKAVFGDDKSAAINHFLTAGIIEGRTGSKEFDYSIYKSCNTDVGGVFDEDIVGYYFHYVKYGKAEDRTAAVYVPPMEDIPEFAGSIEVSAPNGGHALITFDEKGNMTEQIIYDASGVVLAKNKVFYAENGKREQIICSNEEGSCLGNAYYDWNGEYLEVLDIYAYNEGSVIIATDVTEKDGIYQAKYAQAEKNHDMRYMYKPSGSIKYAGKYERDDNNKILRYWDYTIDRLTGYAEYSYTGDKLTRIDNYNRENGRLTDYTLYEYHENGKQKTVTSYNAKGILLSVRKYNEDGKQIEYSTVTLLNGMLESRTVTKYEYNPQRIEVSKIRYNADESISWQAEYEQDANGNLLAEYHKALDGTLVSCVKNKYYESGVKKQSENYTSNNKLTSLYKYNEEGVTTYGENYRYNSKDEVTSHWKGEYDADGNMVKQIYYNPADLTKEMYHIVFEYDEYGQNSQQTQYFPDGRVGYKTVFEDGYHVENYSYSYNGTELTRVSYNKYNKYGDELINAYYDAEGNTLDSTEYEYNEYGDCISRRGYDETGDQYIHSGYEYDEAGNLTVFIHYDGEFETHRCIYTYNEYGNCIKETWRYYDGSEESTVYEYDESGRKTKQIKYDTEGIATRGEEYEYYANGMQKVKKQYYQRGSKLALTDKYEYYENGGTKAIYRYEVSNSTGELLSYSVCRYEDRTGKVLEEKKFDKDDNLLSYCEYEYNAAGRDTRKVEYDTELNILYEYVKEYYENGSTMKKWICYLPGGAAGGKIDWVNEYRENGSRSYYAYYTYNKKTGELANYSVSLYDESGNRISQIVYNADGSVME